MTLPTVFPISMAQIGAELGIAGAFNLQHPYVLLLAGKTAGQPISFSDFLGQAAQITFQGVSSNQGVSLDMGINPPVGIFGSVFTEVDYFSSTNIVTIKGTPARWTGNIIMSNLNTGEASLLGYQGGSLYAGVGNPGLHDDSVLYTYQIRFSP